MGRAEERGADAVTEPLGQLYELRIIATGEVRDADGNLLNTEPIEATRVVTADEAAAILATQETPWPSA